MGFIWHKQVFVSWIPYHQLCHLVIFQSSAKRQLFSHFSPIFAFSLCFSLTFFFFFFSAFPSLPLPVSLHSTLFLSLSCSYTHTCSCSLAFRLLHACSLSVPPTYISCPSPPLFPSLFLSFYLSNFLTLCYFIVSCEKERWKFCIWFWKNQSQ